MKKQKQPVQSADGEAGDYTVGQVSGSLFPDQLKPGALSALFSSASAANTLVFVPAPKPEPKAPTPASGSAVVETQTVRQKKSVRTPSAAEKKLQDRESALQNADDDGPPAVKKAKVKRADDPEEERPAKHKKSGKSSAEERIRMKRTVFVGNLPASCTKKNILSLFKQTGAIESVRFRSVVREDPTMSRKLAAIQNGQEIQTGFHIRVDRVSQHSGHDHKRSIFVGNLPYDLSEHPLREHFQECGNVEAVRLVRDRDSGMGKGFGYVLFESPDSVMLALRLNGSTLLERKIRVKRSMKKEKEKEKKGPPGRPSDARGQERGRGGGGRGGIGRGGGGRGGGGRGGGGRGGGIGRGGFKGPNQDFRNKTGKQNSMMNPGRKQTPASAFKGETADPEAKRGKGLKKKLKQKKKKPAVHI
ncbi:RNA-binding protein 34 isoform X2 [Pseudorasbora parva]|uniref:RNA-binding protein 34 isoform X2 n=1 Tax=Pseudorasbora parva TaxID=51549 RepID=UPI00351EA654